MKKQIKGLRKLSTEEMENVRGGQVETCDAFWNVVWTLITDPRENWQQQG